MDVILEMAFIGAVGGIEIKAEGVRYLRRNVGASAVTRGGGDGLTVSDVDFEARFDGKLWKKKKKIKKSIIQQQDVFDWPSLKFTP